MPPPLPIRILLAADLLSPLHVLGPGRTAVRVDRPIALDEAGYPLLPASSVRGRLRVHLERLLRGWKLPVCLPPSPEQMCPHHWRPGQGPEGGLCLACRIFGSPWHPAGIRNGDLRLSEAQRSEPLLLRQERTGVSLSRRLGTAQDARLFTLETTPPTWGTAPLRLEGQMEGRLSEEEAGWLLAAVALVTHAGGGKARGLGALRLTATEVAWWRDGVWHPTPAEYLIEEALRHAAP